MNSALLTVALLAAAQAADDPSRLDVVQSDEPITIGLGETVFVNVRVRIKRPTFVAIPRAASVDARPIDPRGRGVSVAPWAEVKRVDKRGTRVWVPITGTALGTVEVTMALELRERGVDDPVAVSRVTFNVTVAAKARTMATIDGASTSFARNQKKAKDAYKKLTALHDHLRLDRFDRAPSPQRVQEDDVATLRTYLSARFRAEAARRYVRFAADDAAPELAKAAVAALGKLTAKPTGTLAEARAIDGVSNAKAIALIRNAIDDLRVDEAEGFSNKLLASGRLDPNELAEVLVLRGFIQLVRSAPKTSIRSLGQALCLDRDLETTIKRSMFRAAFETAKAENRCTTPITIQNITAERIGTDEGKFIQVIATFGPDPHRLVNKANVQLWGFGGAVDTAVTVPALHAGGHRIEARMSDSGADRNGNVLLKVFLQSSEGIEVASRGDPDPVSVPLVVGDGGGIDIPWWVWAIAGGVVVAGAATAGAVALSNQQEVQRVVGPVDVRF